VDLARHLISHVVLNGDLVKVLDAGVRPDWLIDPVGRSVWRFITDYYKDFRSVPSQEVLASEFPTYRLVEPAPIDYVLDRLRQARTQAILNQGVYEAMDLLDQGDLESVVTVLNSTLAKLTYEIPKGNDVDITVTGPERLARYRELAERDGSLIGIPTGFWTLDEVTGGFRPGQLIIFTGPPKAGKSLYLLWSAIAAWYAARKVLYIGFEMSNEEQEERLDALIANIDLAALRDGRLTKQDFDKLEQATRSMKLRPNFWLSQEPTLTVSEVCAKIEKYEPNACYIDGIYFMQDEYGEKPGSWQAYTNISRGLKQATKKLEIPIICTTQSKISKMLGGKLSLGSIGYSGSFGEDADLLIGLEPTVKPNITHVVRLAGRACGPFEFWVSRDFQNGTITELTTDPFGDSDAFAEDGDEFGEVDFVSTF